MIEPDTPAHIGIVERRRLLRATAAMCVLFTSTITLADPDLWGHTLYGLRSLDQGVLTETTDPFSYTAAGGRWVNHEWLTELIYGSLWSQLGATGLVAWRVILIALLFVVFLSALEHGKASVGAAVLLLVFATESLADYLIFVRPQLATYVLFAITLFLLRQSWDTPSRKLWWCVPLMAVWTNLHGGFLAGIAISAAFSIVAVISAVREPMSTGRARLFSAVTLTMMAITFLNPYGWQLHQMLWEHLGTVQLVREWQPLWAARQSPIYYVPFGIAAFVLCRSQAFQSIDVVILLLIGWQAVSHLRHVSLLMIAIVILLPRGTSEAVAGTFTQLSRRWSARGYRPVRIAGMIGLFMILSGLRIHGSLPVWKAGIPPWQIAFETGGPVPGMPLRAVDWMAARNIHGNIITDYGWGQFVIWHTFPKSRVAFDGRYRTVYPAPVEAEFIAFQTSKPQSSPEVAMLDNYPSSLAILPVDSEPDQFLHRRSDWAERYRDDQAAIYQKIPGARPEVADPDPRDAVPSPTRTTFSPRWTRFPGTISDGYPERELVMFSRTPMDLGN